MLVLDFFDKIQIEITSIYAAVNIALSFSMDTI